MLIFCNWIYILTYAQLRAFHAVAQERSFQRAAERLHLTQPAVSIQIRNLEDASARVLFRRQGHKVKITEDGRALFEQTSRMFDAERCARELLSGSEETARPIFHLGADGPHVALGIIAKFQACKPGVDVRVTLGNADKIWGELLSLNVDAAIMANARSDPTVISKIVAVQSLTALLPAGHRFSGRRKLSLAEIADSPLIFREQGSNTQRIVDAGFAGHGLQVTPTLVLGSREGVKEAVANGLGIGFVFDREQGEDHRCVAVPLTGLNDTNRDMLLCLKDQRKSVLVDALFRASDTDCAVIQSKI